MWYDQGQIHCFIQSSHRQAKVFHAFEKAAMIDDQT